MTPRQHNIKENTIIPPEGGWEQGVYLVEAAFEADNVIHRSILYLSTVHIKPSREDLEMMGYDWGKLSPIDSPNNWLHGGYEDPESIRRLYYLKVLKKLVSHDELGVYGPSEAKKP